MNIRERFWDKVNLPFDATNNECWLWTGAIAKGYGRISVNSSNGFAHKVSYELYKGRIPEGLFVCHKCDTRNCVNPSHLFLGTALDNTKDMIFKGRANYGIRPKGEAHGRSKLSEEYVKEILASNEKASVLATRYGVTYGTIYDIKNKRRWKHL